MGLLDKLKAKLAGPADPGQGYGPVHGGAAAGRPAASKDPDQAAIERYRYMLRTAPPETVEQAHAEAFAKLTPDQRRKVLADLSSEVPPAERATSDDPRSLARMATRAEMRQPGTMERALGGGRGGGMGMGGMIAGSLLAGVAGAFVGTAIADAFFDMDDGFGGGDEAGDVAGGEDLAGDPGVEDPGAGDLGGGDFGGDLGGGDFGGGEF
jgi:hypothetical protein